MTRAELDVTDPSAVMSAVPGHEVVVNAAAWTDVDGAEEHEEAATRVNGLGPQLLAAACAAEGARLVQVSTDYVFDGFGDPPVPRGRAAGAPLGVRPVQGSRRGRGAHAAAARVLHPAHRLAVRRARPELCPNHGEPGGKSRRP